MITTSALLVTAAIVTTDGVPLRAAPNSSAAQHASLTQGDLLEIRGTRLDYYQVYDHRRERAGFVHVSRVHPTRLQPEDAPHLLSIVRFVRDTSGQEALGISLGQAYLAAVPGNAPRAEVLEAVGQMAQRLAQRASRSQPKTAVDQVMAHLDAVSYLGIRMLSFERNGQQVLCYDGKAYQELLRRDASPAQSANAVLALTRSDCVDPAMTPTQRRQLDEQRLTLLGNPVLLSNDIGEGQKNRLRIREAGVRAAGAYHFARKGQHLEAQNEAQRAIRLLHQVSKTDLTEGDVSEYQEAAIRVGASRWAALSSLEYADPLKAHGLSLATSEGTEGQTCLQLLSGNVEVARRCTYSIVWRQSLSVSSDGTLLTIAVQPTETWRELWVIRKKGNTWGFEVLPPGSLDPELGVVEFAGGTSNKLLIARDHKEQGQARVSFEVVDAKTLTTESRFSRLPASGLVNRMQSAQWRNHTLTLR